MTTLILARHGRSTSNSAGTLAGRTPGIELDERGVEQATALGERLRGIGLDAVVSSPLKRCRSTAELALSSAGLDLPVQLDDRVMETDYGSWSGRLLKDLAELPQWRQVQQSPSSVVFPDGEAMLGVRTRVSEAVQDWNTRLGPEAVWLLVSHGDPITALLSWALGMDFDRVQSLTVDPASVSIVHFPTPKDDASPAHPRIATINSISGPLAGWIAPVEANVGGGLGAAGGSDSPSPSPQDGTTPAPGAAS